MSINIPLDILKNKQKVALITGGAQGIGAEIVRSFLNKGYFVAFVDYNEQLGLEQEKRFGVHTRFYRSDLRELEQVRALAEQLVQELGVIDTIVHNAKSPAREKGILENLEKEWDTTFQVMLKHPLVLNELLLELLKKSDNPSILYIGSTNAHFISQQPLSYHVVKGALSQAVRYLACEYGPYRIRVNLLHPGIVDIPGRVRKDPETFQKTIESVIPLKRAALAREIGDVCLFFASSEAKYLTGSSLDLDGGEHLKDHFHLMISHFTQQAEVQK